MPYPRQWPLGWCHSTPPAGSMRLSSLQTAVAISSSVVPTTCLHPCCWTPFAATVAQSIPLLPALRAAPQYYGDAYCNFYDRLPGIPLSDYPAPNGVFTNPQVGRGHEVREGASSARAGVGGEKASCEWGEVRRVQKQEKAGWAIRTCPTALTTWSPRHLQRAPGPRPSSHQLAASTQCLPMASLHVPPSRFQSTAQITASLGAGSFLLEFLVESVASSHTNS